MATTRTAGKEPGAQCDKIRAATTTRKILIVVLGVLAVIGVLTGGGLYTGSR